MHLRSSAALQVRHENQPQSEDKAAAPLFAAVTQENKPRRPQRVSSDSTHLLSSSSDVRSSNQDAPSPHKRRRSSRNTNVSYSCCNLVDCAKLFGASVTAFG